MVTIRLSRLGRTKDPFYRIVAVDHTKKLTGANLGVLGTWNPREKKVQIDKKEIAKWVAKGAKVSPAVAKLM